MEWEETGCQNNKRKMNYKLRDGGGKEEMNLLLIICEP